MKQITFYQMIRRADFENIKILPLLKFSFPKNDCIKEFETIFVSFLNIFDYYSNEQKLTKNRAIIDLMNVLNQHIYKLFYLAHEKKFFHLRFEKGNASGFNFFKKITGENLLFNFKYELLCVRLVKENIPSAMTLVFILQVLMQSKVSLKQFISETTIIAPTILNQSNNCLGDQVILGKKTDLIGRMFYIIIERIHLTDWIELITNNIKINYINDVIKNVVGAYFRFKVYVNVFVGKTKNFLGDNNLFFGKTIFLGESCFQFYMIRLI